MLVLTRRDLAKYLAAYGEHLASSRVAVISSEEYERACEIGFQHALRGVEWGKAASLAVIEVLEGAPRELRTNRPDWTEVPESLMEPDPDMLSVMARFERYGGGDPVKKSQVIAHISNALSGSLPSFRYYRSYFHFRRPYSQGFMYVGLHYAKGTLALGFGVRDEGIEELKTRVLGDAAPSTQHSPWTISKLSFNMGPHSPRWPHPVEVTWPISGTKGLVVATDEAAEFVRDTALPYVLRHQDRLEIRNTLLHSPGRADGWLPEDSTVLAIDYLARRRDWLDEDFRLFNERYAKAPASRRDSLERRYRAAVRLWDEGVASPQSSRASASR